MSTQRTQQADQPGQLPRSPTRPEVKGGQAPAPDVPGQPRPGPDNDQVQAQLAGALAALAGRLDRLAAVVDAMTPRRPVVTFAQRQEALEAARDWIDGVPQPYPRVSLEARISTELLVASFFTGETWGREDV